MASIDGNWSFTSETPMGVMRGTMTAAAEGDTLTGVVSGDFGEVEICEGTISPDGEFTWKIHARSPLPITINCAVRVDCDTFTGTISALAVGSFPFTGERTE